MTITSQCPICHQTLPAAVTLPEFMDDVRIDCVNCGSHVLIGRALAALQSVTDVDTRARIAHRVARVPRGKQIGILQIHTFSSMPLPTALELIDNLILWLGARLAPGGHLELESRHIRASIGALNADAATWALQHALTSELIEGKMLGGMPIGFRVDRATLTPRGWARYADMLRSGSKSKHAFMAMKFNNPELDAFFSERLQPAVAQTGFKLRITAGDHATAGSIDDRMRVEIRTSRFLLCDLSHANNGAYWEAGFAEGLGRPVFYICRHDVLADKQHQHHPHFDTAHQLIIPWDPASPDDGLQKLKNAIRATLPDEATMSDEGAAA